MNSPTTRKHYQIDNHVWGEMHEKQDIDYKHVHEGLFKHLHVERILALLLSNLSRYLGADLSLVPTDDPVDFDVAEGGSRQAQRDDDHRCDDGYSDGRSCSGGSQTDTKKPHPNSDNTNTSHRDYFVVPQMDAQGSVPLRTYGCQSQQWYAAQAISSKEINRSYLAKKCLVFREFRYVWYEEKRGGYQPGSQISHCEANEENVGGGE